MTSLNYHQQSFELIRSKQEFSGDTFPELPPSVAEWYSLMDGVRLLEKYSNEDVPAHPSGFKISRHNDKELAVFLYENQGVYWWGFEIGDDDDPRVYVNVDPPPDRWVLCCEKFSYFVFTRLFDFFHWHDDNLMAWGFGKRLEKSVLDRLRSEYTAYPVTYGGISDTQYRFSYQDRKITIHEREPGSEWYLSADSPAAVKSMLERFDDMFEGHYPEANSG